MVRVKKPRIVLAERVPHVSIQELILLIAIISTVNEANIAKLESCLQMRPNFYIRNLEPSLTPLALTHSQKNS